MKPNLFSIATRELSQDAFITWLLQWSDDSFLKENSDLCKIGKSFIKELLCLKYKIAVDEIKKVTAGRQWANIDIWAEVNDEYIIIIEDKMNTSEHDNQLERYKTIIEDEYGKTIKMVCVYLKTGLETLDNVRKIKDKGWLYYSRKDFLSFLQKNTIDNEIFSDYLSNLSELQKESDSYTKYNKLNSWEATKGLYSYIETQLENDWLHWDYVPNPNGGFLGLWFHFTPISSNPSCELYLQIENYCTNRINLFIKICGKWERTIDYLYKVFNILQKESLQFNLILSKPQKFRIGNYTSVAIVNDVFKQKGNEDLDLENLIQKIKNTIDLVDFVAGGL